MGGYSASLYTSFSYAVVKPIQDLVGHQPTLGLFPLHQRHHRGRFYDQLSTF
jgi:hypothetical protein